MEAFFFVLSLFLFDLKKIEICLMFFHLLIISCFLNSFIFHVFYLRFFSFCLFLKVSLHSGRSKVTRVTVGRDTDQPKLSSL